jgi:hypothetical protein
MGGEVVKMTTPRRILVTVGALAFGVAVFLGTDWLTGWIGIVHR